MLSNTGGYVKQSRTLGRRRDDTTLCSTLCPAMRTRGFCRAYAREARIRAEVAAKKEEELLRSATELFKLQEEVLDEGTAADEEQRTGAIAKIVAELKCEKSYENWSLDVEVAEHMTALRLRRCPYSHRREMQAELRRLRRVEMAEAEGKGESRKEVSNAGLSRRRSVAAEERWRVFESLTTLQKCVVCLMWQGCVELPQKVVCDVRRLVEAELLHAGGGGEEEEEDVDDVDIEAEEQRVVTVTACRPSLGIVDLSSLPHIVAYISQHPGDAVIRPETVEHFTGGSTRLHFPRGVTEKQVDIGSPACAHELVEAVVWALGVMNEREDQQRESRPQRKIVLRSLILRRCAMTNADAVINALRKHQLDTTLLALDMSNNRLTSLRFLFILRAYFSTRLLRLSLENNPITRKPEYREQVRKSLPRLTSLDGRAIRRPPLSLPHPTPASHTFDLPSAEDDTQSRRALSGDELDAVMDGLARFLYTWETRRVPWTLAELNYQRRQQQRRQQYQQSRNSGEKEEEEGSVFHLPEEDLDDDNFHHRYLHPSSTFTMSLHEDLSFVDSARMRLATEVEMDDSYTGMRLSPLDMRDLRVFDVAMKGNSRDLLKGRSILHRFARGSLNCYAAYNYSMYPQRLEVCHNLKGAIVSVSKITDTSAPSSNNFETAAVAKGESELKVKKGKTPQQPGRKKRRADAVSSTSSHSYSTASPASASPAPFSMSIRERKPTFYIVTIHGVMSWRAPSMKRSECILAAYDRVMTFVENALPPTNPVEKRRTAPLLLFNDEVHLRPATNGHLAWFTAQTEERVARLVVEYGLEACADGESLVRAVAERASSDAAASAAMGLLVFGTGIEPAGRDGDVQHGARDKQAPPPRYFDICSVISAEKNAVRRDDGDNDSDNGDIDGEVVESVPHRVTLAQVDATVAAMNKQHTISFASFASSSAVEENEKDIEPKRRNCGAIKTSKRHREEKEEKRGV